MNRLFANISLLFLFLFLAPVFAIAQSTNLLQNPGAEMNAEHWQAFGQATIEEFDGKRSFVVRGGGYFLQDVLLPEGAAGQYVVLMGHGSSERINADGAITGLPYLYGYMMASDKPNGDRIFDYLQGQRMLSSAKVANEWVKMWGIFKVPVGASTIRFFLNQALRGGVPHNGSAARFDDLGLYLFATKEEAQAFVDQYN